MNVVIVDDEEIAIEVLERMLLTQEDVKIVGKYTDPKLALSEIKHMDVDAIFLDLEMGTLHGIQFTELLYNENESINIVFVTAYSSYALEAFDLNAIDYLLKPVSRERLNQTLEKLKKESILSKKSQRVIQPEKNRLYIHTMGMYWMSDSAGDIPIRWRTKKVKELFAFLIHHKDHPVHRTLIMDELWPETLLDKAAALLHTTVYQLRKLLKEIGYENAIQYGNEQYRLDIETDSDVKQLYELIRLPSPKQEDIKMMISLYEGDYFEQEEYSWVIYDQQKIRKAFLQQMERFLSILAKESPKDNFIENCLTKMYQMDIYNDDYAYQLMLYYEKTKNTRKFIEVYTNFQKRLKEELGLNIPFKLLSLYSKFMKSEG